MPYIKWPSGVVHRSGPEARGFTIVVEQTSRIADAMSVSFGR